jgi:hypothetical protein
MFFQYMYLGTGIYTFKVHGQICHKLDQLKPGGKGPRHMQLYFYDTDNSMSHRIKRSPHLDSNLIRAILELPQHNPYVRAFRSLGEMNQLDEYKIELNTYQHFSGSKEIQCSRDGTSSCYLARWL